MNTQIKVLELVTQQRNSSQPPKRYYTKPRVYLSLRMPEKTEFNAIDDLLLRRLHNPQKLKPVIVEELKKHGIVINKIRWSRYAGCSCPCSPGFILEDIGMLNAGNPSNGFAGLRFDAWMTYTISNEQ